jgi:hypothetical protein
VGNNGEEDLHRPKQLSYDSFVSEDCTAGLSTTEAERMTTLIKNCGERIDRTDFTGGWRQERWETRLEKLKSSLVHYTGFSGVSDDKKEVEGTVSYSDVISRIEDAINAWPPRN